MRSLYVKQHIQFQSDTVLNECMIGHINALEHHLYLVY